MRSIDHGYMKPTAPVWVAAWSFASPLARIVRVERYADDTNVEIVLEHHREGGQMSARDTRCWICASLFSALVVAVVVLSGCASSAPFPNGRLPAASSQDVTLATDHASYSTRTPIGVTLANSGGTTYYGLDGRSDCTLIQLQRYDSGSARWVSVDGCTPAQTPRALQVPAGAREPFTLTPNSSGDPNAWQIGIYRVAAAYSPNVDAVSGEHVAYSAGFRIEG